MSVTSMSSSARIILPRKFHLPSSISCRTLVTFSQNVSARRPRSRDVVPGMSTMFAPARLMSLASPQLMRTSDIPKAPSVLLRSPTVEDLEAQELDVDLISKDQIDIVFTARAAEQLQRISTREGNTDVALRVSVESGGCHGHQYRMELAHERAPEDYHFTHPDIRPSNLFIDAVSLPMLNGSTVDYATELIGSSFRISGNPQAKSGCGCGVSWELND